MGASELSVQPPADTHAVETTQDAASNGNEMRQRTMRKQPAEIQASSKHPGQSSK